LIFNTILPFEKKKKLTALPLAAAIVDDVVLGVATGELG